MRSWLVGTSFIVILSLVAVVPGFADDPSKDPFYTQGVSKDAPPINTVTEAQAVQAATSPPSTGRA
jgi:hypothetical protein